MSKEVTALNAGTAPDGSEEIHVVQGGNSRKLTLAEIIGLGGNNSLISARYWRVSGLVSGEGFAEIQFRASSTGSALSGTVSTTTATADTANLTDADLDTFWEATGADAIEIDLGSGNDNTVRVIIVTAPAGADSTKAPLTWDLDYSSDGSTWTNIASVDDTVTGAFTDNEQRTYNLGGQVSSVPDGSGAGTITVQKDDSNIATGVGTVNFEGDVTVTDDTGGKVTVTVTASSADPVTISDSQLVVSSRTETDPPAGPSTGARYIVPTGATGAWMGETDKIAEWNGSSWTFEGLLWGSTAYVSDVDDWYRRDNTGWVLWRLGGEPTQSIIVAASDETTDLTTGTAKVTFRMPYAFTLTEVRASVTTAPVGSALTVDINEGGVSILSTLLTIDDGEKTSTTAAVAAVISDTALADDAEITVDIDAVGSGTAGAGLKVTLIGRKA